MLQKLRRRGLTHTAETLFNRIVPAWLFRFSVGDVLNLDLPKMADGGSASDSESLEFVVIENDEQRSQLRQATWNSVVLETTLNDIGYAIRRRDTGDIIGGVWVGVDSFLESDLGFRVQLRRDQAWLYCAYIDKAFRGGGLYRRLLGFVADDVRRRGYHELNVVIQPWNKASMHVHRKLAKHRLGRIVAIRMLSLASVNCFGSLQQSSRFTSQPRQRPISLSVDNDPVVDDAGGVHDRASSQRVQRSAV